MDNARCTKQVLLKRLFSSFDEKEGPELYDAKCTLCNFNGFITVLNNNEVYFANGSDKAAFPNSFNGSQNILSSYTDSQNNDISGNHSSDINSKYNGDVITHTFGSSDMKLGQILNQYTIAHYLNLSSISLITWLMEVPTYEDVKLQVKMLTIVIL